MRPFKPRARAAKTSMQMRHEGYGVRGGVSRTPPIGTRVFGEGGGGGVLHPKTAAAASARGRGGPRAAEDGAKRHSSGGDRCLGVRVSLIMLVWNSGKPVLFRVQWLGRPGARRGTAPPLPSVYTYQARCLAVRGPQAHLPKSYQSYQFWIQSSLGSTKHRCMRPRRLPDPRPTPRELREPIYIRKK